MSGVKFNQGKPSDLHLIPLTVLAPLFPAHMHALACALHGWARRGVASPALLEAVRGSRGEGATGPIILEALGPLQYGREKYAAYNWEKGLPFTAVSDAGLRHALGVPYDSEGRPTTHDPESGLNHVEHLVCNVMFAACLSLHNLSGKLEGIDNRPLLDEEVSPQ